MSVKKAIAYVEVEIHLECPQCSHQVARDSDECLAVVDAVRDNWHEVNLGLTCPECECEFVVDKIDWF